MPIDFAALRGEPPQFVCRFRGCGSTDIDVTQTDNPSKPVKVKCRTCGRTTWPPKPENEKRRRDRNPAHRKRWRELLDGEFVCTWCRVRESQTRCEFHCDHIQPLEFDGPDEFENTMILCANCHTRRGADQASVRHLLGKSARAGQLEAA